ncbi:MAG: hypothetical protein QME14_00915 [Methanobacteriaceae archaeon]|nr:hypothetical protein [Methanobacteriaceae archaeon]
MDTNQEEKKSFKERFFKEKEFKTSEFVGAIIVNIIFLYIVNNLLNWNLSFIAPSFSEVLSILNISIIANIMANIGFLVYQRGWFRSIVQIILNLIGFIVAYTLYTVFPFTFQSIWVTYALLLILIIGMVGLVISSIYEILRLILTHEN